ncbi:conserved hypothetical protein [Carboxydothermus pertinax]|uniref:MobA-like NTP transferase domain-containing protein n=2 Tax=Carboxydothermus pertinax TaxID=870242 RepID=A0A1L8CSM7_9THEO|nr:conserved hypothetical protein [Carboxydothermus pertinax]
MGRNKLSLPLLGKTVLEQTVTLYQQTFPEILVITPLLIAPSSVQEGMGGTLREAARLIPPSWQGVVVALGDMPFIAPTTLKTFFAAIEKAPEEVWALSFQGRRGHPVYLPRRYFSLFSRLFGDVGLRQLLPELTPKTIDTEDYGVVFDLDKPEDYEPYGKLILVKGAGDIASGIIWRLYQAGFKVVATELLKPTTIRRPVAFAQAVFTGEHTVEGVLAKKATLLEVPNLLVNGIVPVVPDEEGVAVKGLKPWAVVDARLAKRNLGTTKDEAKIVIGVGPGFTAPDDVHAVIETKRGHFLGRAIYQGTAEPNTGVPGEIGGHTVRRVIYASASGRVHWYCDFGQRVNAGMVLGEVAGEKIIAQISGVVRGLIHPEVDVRAGMKIGDIDPRGIPEYATTISEKALAVAGGVLEALLKLDSSSL